MMIPKKYKAWLLKEKKMVFVDTIHWNKGYGNALEIHVDNPEFNAYKDIIENPKSNVMPFFSYINHSLDVHKKANNGDDFVLLRPVDLDNKHGIEIYEGSILSDYTNTDEGIVKSYCQVFWNVKTGSWHLDNSYYQDKTSSNELLHELNDFKYFISGNIYETPELLTKK